MAPLDDVLDEILDEKKPLRDTAIVDMSDLDRDGITMVRERWDDTEVGRRREIVSRLAELAEDNFYLDFTSMLRICLGDPDPPVREKAISGIEQYEDAVFISPLVHSLTEDKSETVRTAAAWALGKFVLMAELGKTTANQTSQVHTALLDIVENRDESTELRRRALESLSPWCSPKVAELIEDAYHSGETNFRTSAVYAMGKNCDSRWLPTLFRELKGDNLRQRYEAAHSCGEIADPEAVPHLLPLMHTEDIEVQTAVIWALGQIGGREAKKALRSLLEEDDGLVRGAVQEALVELSLGDDSAHI